MLFQKKSEFKKFMESHGERIFGQIEKMIKMYCKKGYSAGDALTWADIFLYELTSGVIALDAAFTTRFPEIKNVRASVEKNANLMQYVKNRPPLPL